MILETNLSKMKGADSFKFINLYSAENTKGTAIHIANSNHCERKITP